MAAKMASSENQMINWQV